MWETGETQFLKYVEARFYKSPEHAEIFSQKNVQSLNNFIQGGNRVIFLLLEGIKPLA